MRQLPLPGIKPPIANPRRSPRRRRGESWRSFSVRYNTWFYTTWPDEFWAEAHERGRRWQERRRTIAAADSAYGRIQRELARMRHSRGEDGLWFIEVETTLSSGRVASTWMLTSAAGALYALSRLGLVQWTPRVSR
jgi:hypothetical protein